jgi:hypothetical protein
VDDLIYAFAIWCAAAILLAVVNRFEPNRRLAIALRFLILALGFAAIASRVIR